MFEDDLTLLFTVKRLHDAGLAIVPLKADGSKMPKTKWKKYVDCPPRWHELTPFFRDGNSAIAVLGGSASGGLEILDFDDVDVFPVWSQSVADIIKSLPIIETPTGGRHIYYRCEMVEGNQGLAWTASGEIKIETRGHGGYVIAPGSPLSTHPTGNPYRLVQGDLTAIPTISIEERKRMFEAAEAFNEWTIPVFQGTQVVKEKCRRSERPGDEFNRSATWTEILCPHGWEFLYEVGGVGHWRKPGSTSKTHHATTDHQGPYFYCFSTSAPPFDSEAYTKFAAYTLLEHGGDFNAAAEALHDKGYGEDAKIANYIKVLYG